MIKTAAVPLQADILEHGMKRILIIGAAGKIGNALRQGLRGSYSIIRLADIASLGSTAADEELATTDIRDMAALEKAMVGIDCVVHLAGVPEEAAWDQVLPLNIEGCYNVFEAARRCGVKRVIFASSNHAVGFHRRERFIDNTVDPRPDSRYGVSKVFGEALGRLYADKYGLSVACLRIGTFRTPDRPVDARQLLTWISHRDMVQLVRRCIDHPNYHFVTVYGVSLPIRLTQTHTTGSTRASFGNCAGFFRWLRQGGTPVLRAPLSGVRSGEGDKPCIRPNGFQSSSLRRAF